MWLFEWIGRVEGWFRGPAKPTVDPVGKREPVSWEWEAKLWCGVCRHKGKHRFIRWSDGIETAECKNCGFEATV